MTEQVLQRNVIINVDVLSYLETVPDNSVNCVVTSPPYWGLRDYGTGEWVGGDPNCKHQGRQQSGEKADRDNGTMRDKNFSVCPKCGAQKQDLQIGLEPTLKEFIEHLVIVFREVRRVLRPDGVCFINMGDSYASTPNGRSAVNTKAAGNDDRTFRDKPVNTVGGGYNLKPKDLCGQPHRLVFALQDDGCFFRDEIIWHKRSPMPESVQDRCTRAHEFVFMLTKEPRYWYDQEAIREPTKTESIERAQRAVSDHHKNLHIPGQTQHSIHKARANGEGYNMPETRNKRSVWSLTTEPLTYAHFATFPTKLIEPMILVGCPEKCCAECGKPWKRDMQKQSTEFNQKEGVAQALRNAGAQDGGTERVTLGKTHLTSRQDLGLSPDCECNAGTIPGVVLDPFMGSGTVALVARALKRDYVGCELNPEYMAIQQERLRLPFEPHALTIEDKPLDKSIVSIGGETWEQSTLFD